MGRTADDLTGMRFADGGIVVLRRAKRRNHDNHARWRCQCEYCGKIFTEYGCNLKAGRRISCGCKRGEPSEETETRLSEPDVYESSSEEQWHDLANAIIEVAAKDYQEAVSSGDDREAKGLEDFFYSDWFSVLTKLDPNMLVGKLRAKGGIACES